MKPLRIRLVLEHELVLRLRCADAVIENLVPFVLRRQRGRFARRIVSAVEEAVTCPVDSRHLRPLHDIVERFARLDLHYVELGPVRSTRRDPIGHVAVVLRQCQPGESGRAVRRKPVGIEKNPRLALETLLYVPHVLILQSVVLREDEVLAFPRGRAVARIVVELRETRFHRLAKWNLLQISERDLVLFLHPLRRLRRVLVLEPAVWIGNGIAKVDIYLRNFPGFRIGKRLRRADYRNRQRGEKSERESAGDRHLLRVPHSGLAGSEKYRHAGAQPLLTLANGPLILYVRGLKFLPSPGQPIPEASCHEPH